MKVEKVAQHLIGKTYKEVVSALSTEGDYGDCCGWYDYSVEDGVESRPDHQNAVLRDVIEIDYSDEGYSRVVVNFIFDLGEEQGLILGYELSAGSGSGWSYGAYCSLKYNDEEITYASW